MYLGLLGKHSQQFLEGSFGFRNHFIGISQKWSRRFRVSFMGRIASRRTDDMASLLSDLLTPPQFVYRVSFFSDWSAQEKRISEWLGDEEVRQLWPPSRCRYICNPVAALPPETFCACRPTPFVVLVLGTSVNSPRLERAKLSDSCVLAWGFENSDMEHALRNR